MPHGTPSIPPLQINLQGVSGNALWNIGPIERNTHEPLITEEYHMGLINEHEVQDQLEPLNLQKQAIQSNSDDLRASEGAWQVSRAEIEKIIGSLAKEVRHADPINKKRGIQTLFREIQIFPKEGAPWRRKLTIKGVYLPMTGVFVASPRGFEPLSPA